MCKIDIQVIYTFLTSEQLVGQISVPANIVEEKLIELLLFGFSDEQLADLVKISTCQYAVNKGCIQYLLNRNGKYYKEDDLW
jgi:hypothetical protein